MEKKVIVVGASSGIGKEVARNYAKNGAQVAITGRRTALLEEISNEFPGQVIYETFDEEKWITLFTCNH